MPDSLATEASAKADVSSADKPSPLLTIIMTILFVIAVIMSLVYTLRFQEPRATVAVLFAGTLPVLLLLVLSELKKSSTAAGWQQVLGLMIFVVALATLVVCVALMVAGDSDSILTPDTVENYASSVLLISVPVAVFGWVLSRGLLRR